MWWWVDGTDEEKEEKEEEKEENEKGTGKSREYILLPEI